jgi:hypothetical protein
MSAALKIDTTRAASSLETLALLGVIYAETVLGGLEKSLCDSKIRENARRKLSKLVTEGATWVPTATSFEGRAKPGVKVIHDIANKNIGTSDGRAFIAIALPKTGEPAAFYAALLAGIVSYTFGNATSQNEVTRTNARHFLWAMLAGKNQAAQKPKGQSAAAILAAPREGDSLAMLCEATCEAHRAGALLPGATLGKKKASAAKTAFGFFDAKGAPCELPVGKGWAKVRALACEAFAGANISLRFTDGSTFVGAIGALPSASVPDPVASVPVASDPDPVASAPVASVPDPVIE